MIKMITLQQIKAARALLNWTQGDLALHSGVSVPAIARLEQGNGNARADTVHALHQAFETHGIEFYETTGVNLRTEIFKIDILDGADAMQQIWDDVVATLGKHGGGEFLMNGMDEHLWVKFFGDRLDAEIKRRRNSNITHRLLIQEGDNLCLGSDEVYRTVPQAVFGQTPYFIYGNKHALINWGPPMRIVRIECHSAAETMRKQFNFNWDMGKPIKTQKILYPIINSDT